MSLFPLLFTGKATICISSRWFCQNIGFMKCMTDFYWKYTETVKPSFLECDLKYLSALESSARLKLTASSMKLRDLKYVAV